jgi:hypothetical protein
MLWFGGVVVGSGKARGDKEEGSEDWQHQSRRRVILFKPSQCHDHGTTLFLKLWHRRGSFEIVKKSKSIHCEV